MVKCPSCGKEVGDAAFCNNCGSKLHSQKNEKIKSNDFQEKKFCANCGSEIYSIYDSYKSIKKITNGESVEDIMFFNKFM